MEFVNVEVQACRIMVRVQDQADGVAKSNSAIISDVHFEPSTHRSHRIYVPAQHDMVLSRKHSNRTDLASRVAGRRGRGTFNSKWPKSIDSNDEPDGGDSRDRHQYRAGKYRI